MLDFGWSEFLLVGVLAVLLLGPKELPEVMYFLGKIARRVHYLKFALSQQFDEMMRDAETRSVQKPSASPLPPRSEELDDEPHPDQDEEELLDHLTASHPDSQHESASRPPAP